MTNINRIAVYCASSSGKNPIYTQKAQEMGRIIANENKTVVYGGASIGLMGAVADGCLMNGGHVIGVLPKFMEEKEIAHKGVSEHITVNTMHERKAKMAELADAFIALPGGFGTMEELFEVITWAQLALHSKPIGLLNTDKFYDPLITFVDEMIDRGFVKPTYRELLIVEENPKALLEKLENYTPKTNNKWFETK